MKIAILRLYCGDSGQKGFYNMQELGIAKAYADKNNSVLIVIPDKNAKKENTEFINDKISLLKVPAKTIGVHAFFNLDFLITEKIELVQLAADNQIYAPYIIKFCKKHNIDFYNYIGTIYSDSTNKIKSMILKFFSKRNIRYFKKTKTFVKTTAVKEQLENAGVKDVRVVPVGLDLSVIPEINETSQNLRIQLNLPIDKKIVLFVGRLAEYKKPLEAVELINKLNDNYHLLIIGKGELKDQLYIKVEEYRLNNRVTFIESVPNIDIHKYYKAADCLVNFNDKEIFGMSILEAMYQECPVVAIHAPGPDDIINDGVTGYLCHTTSEMIEKIKIINKKIGAAGRESVINNFIWDKAVEKFIV